MGFLAVAQNYSMFQSCNWKVAAAVKLYREWVRIIILHWLLGVNNLLKCTHTIAWKRSFIIAPVIKLLPEFMTR